MIAFSFYSGSLSLIIFFEYPIILSDIFVSLDLPAILHMLHGEDRVVLAVHVFEDKIQGDAVHDRPKYVTFRILSVSFLMLNY